VLRDGTRLGEVTELFVTPEARDVSVGERLLTGLVEWCRSRGCAGVDAFALPGHRAAKNFFESAGFTARALLMHHDISD
jgi:GNAT superfamily N-acetyltransferase